LHTSSESNKTLIATALSKLGVERLALAIHDQSFPSLRVEEVGRGSPYSAGGKQFAQFISELGFNAIQFGPQGKTSRSNPSPYDSTLFSKNELSISLHGLAHDAYWQKLLSEEDVAQASSQVPQARSLESYQYAWDVQYAALRKAYDNFVARKDQLQHVWLAYAIWQKQQAYWLERDSLFEALATEYGTDDWRQWSALDQALPQGATEEHKNRIAEILHKRARDVEFFQFCQYVAHHQHQEFRQSAKSLGLKLYADLQIGFSHRDMWSLRHLLLPNYLLGAPPSRTNPDGQPWGYPVLNPELYFETDGSQGPALKFVTSRIDKLLQDFDGVRIDHPHGIVCPWIYKADEPDSLRAVQQGARLFESPNVADHPGLAKYSHVTPEQLNSHIPRYGDAWVASLTDEQIEKYAVIVQLIKDRVQGDVICEVLSSCPFPLKAILQKHKLGRFRVTQKAQPHMDRDVYRSNNAQPEDWIMVGTHDTKTIWRVIDEWTEGEKESWAEYLSRRLHPDDEAAADAAYGRMSANDAELADGIIADLFIGPARNVSIFFADLFGLKEIYNRPGVVSDENWVLSVPNEWNRVAMNLPRALAKALRAHGADTVELAEQLEKTGEVIPAR
jgi:4-alpha-glucanotransferase